jgi:putative ABC transport system substrate-binding protein
MLARSAATFLILVCSVVAQAQPATGVFRVGFLTPLSSTPEPPQLRAFREGLRQLGYVEGKNLVIEMRFADGKLDRLPELCAELVRSKVDVLLAGSPAGVRAAIETSASVPVVFAGVNDPVGSRIVTSLARPGGNVTGVAVGAGGPGFGAKWLELLREAAPGATHLAALANRSNPSNSLYLEGVERAAGKLKVKVDVHDAGNPAELDRAFAAIGASGVQGLIVTTDPFLLDQRMAIVRFAASKKLPTVYFFKPFVEAGGLMSYGGSLEESYRRAATYVDRILKGAKPADLPIEQPTRVELVINARAAKALGLTIPSSLLLRADQVLE